MKNPTSIQSSAKVVVALGLFAISLNAHARADIKRCADLDLGIIHQKSSSYQEMINKYARQYRVDADFVKSVIAVESCYNPKARSAAGASGLMQLMPATARRFGVKNRVDPEQNIHGGIRYLRFLIERYDADLRKVAAAYNAGEGNVDKHGGVPPFRETKRYVGDVFKLFERLDKDRKLTKILTESASFKMPLAP